jgi:ribosomal protein S18 acetylase RimI-like enzyme
MTNQVQHKIEFIWDERCPLAPSTETLSYQAVDTPAKEGEFAHAVRCCLSGALDVADQETVALKGLSAAVRSYVQPSTAYAFDRAWWRLAYNADGALVGFTQPVIFRDGERDGLQEGSLHYIGVLPAHRGMGYVNALLRESTVTLRDVGVWRIYCDTDENNTPMIHAFERAGYRRGKVRVIELQK